MIAADTFDASTAGRFVHMVARGEQILFTGVRLGNPRQFTFLGGRRLAAAGAP